MWILCLTLGLLASALPAWTAEIVEVRVGRHPEFTRVVFELDRAAGYRIERSSPKADVTELIVSLEAASIPRSINATKSLIEHVGVEPQGSRSVARIRLAKDSLGLKEMILSNPPRIVLDVLNDVPPAPSVARAPSAKPKVEKARASDDQDFDAVVAQLPAKAPQKAEASNKAEALKKAEAAKKAAASEKVAALKQAEAPKKATAPALAKAPKAIEPAVVVDPQPIERPIGNLRQAVAKGSDDEFDDAPRMDPDSASNPRPNDELAAVQEVAKPAPAPMPVKPKPAATPAPAAKPATPRPMVAKSASADDGAGWMTWALAGVGVVVLLVAGAFALRQRSAGDVIDEWNSGDDSDSHADGGVFGASVEDNPFSGFSSDTKKATRGAKDAGAAKKHSLLDEEKESESVVFDETEEKVMDDMEVISREQVNESLGGAMPPGMGAAIPEEFQQMMAEMNRRMEALESRCDELVDARDRLERQVAAQTEELRVQRAAIARTQRAVRNLGRPEGEEQEATEPALRDPNQSHTE